MGVAELDLDLDVFAGPFDLLLTLVLREEITLAEVQLGEVVLAYLEHLEDQGELDLEAATEFLVLIASLLELKSRLLLPPPVSDEPVLGPEEAADELLARMLEYRRYRDAAAHLHELFTRGRRYLYRAAPLPPELRRVSLDAARPAYGAGRAVGALDGAPAAIRDVPTLCIGRGAQSLGGLGDARAGVIVARVKLRGMAALFIDVVS
jgi:segregation and condensation protein A